MTAAGPTSDRTIEVAGLPIRASTKGAGPCLVVLHRSTGPYWTSFHDRLAEVGEVVAVDMPGYGRSQRPDFARSPRDLAILVQRFTDQLGAPEVHVVGLGLGGWVAAEMCAMDPRRLASLTLVGAAGMRPTKGFVHDPMMSSWESYVRLGLYDEGVFDRVFGPTPDADVVTLWDLSREMTARITWKPWMWSEQLKPLLSQAEVAASVVWGSDDRVVPLDCGQQYADTLGADLVTVERSGHLAELDDPDAVAASVGRLISAKRD